LEATVVRLEAVVADLLERVAVRDARIVELEGLLEESRRSGKRQAAPFSKGKPSTDPARPGRKSGRGHGRHGHRRVPEQVDRTVEAPLPRCCPDCGGGVTFERWAEQFQTELPPVAPVVTRFRVGVGRCQGCRRRVQGRHAEQASDALGAAAAQVGPRAKALASWLHYSLGLSFARCATVLGHFGVDVTAGALSTASAATATALAPTTEAIKAHVGSAPAVTMDETGWRIEGLSAWLWAAATTDATVYDIAWGRGYDQACGLVPASYTGTIVRDGWAPYRSYVHATHQSCIAHLLRRCTHMATDLPAWARGTPREVKDLLLEALAARNLDATERAEAVCDIDERIELLCDRPHPHPANQRLVKHLANERSALLTFLTTPGVDATNWRGEQAIRPAVVNRKTWGGNRTETGARTQSQLMTFLRTAHQQGADAINLLADLARAPTPAVTPGLTLRPG
jgi:transposase